MFNWQTIGMASIAGIAAYLTKNIFTQPDQEKQSSIGGSTPPKDKDQK